MADQENNKMSVVPNKVTSAAETRPRAMVDLPEINKREGLPPLEIDAPTKGAEYAACFYKKT